MKFSKKVNYVLFGFLVLINFVLRYPINPHESGWDSFYIHNLAETISVNGYANWIIHPLSYIGVYPFSYASGIPFTLSGLSQTTGIGMEWTIWVFTTIIGILSAFTAYIMAKEIKNNDLFCFLAAFAFSTCSGILDMSSWQISTRGPFLALTPLVIYFLLKSRRTSSLRYTVLTIFLFVTLVSIHKFFLYLLLIFVAYFIAIQIFRLRKHIPIKIPNKVTSVVLMMLFLMLFFLPFTSLFEEQVPPWIDSSSRGLPKHTWITSIVLTNARYIGVLGIFAVAGFVWLIFKDKKRFEEIFLILALLVLSPLLVFQTYTKWFSLIFVFPLVGIGMVKVIDLLKNRKKVIFPLLVVTLLIAVSVSGYFQYQHPKWFSKGDPYNERYMTEHDYDIAMYMKYKTNNIMIGNEATLINRVSAIANLPQINMIEFDKWALENIKMRKIIDFKFWTDCPYVVIYEGEHSAQWELNVIYRHKCDDEFSERILSEYGIEYALQNNKRREDTNDGAFFESLHEIKYELFDNGKGSVWYVG